MKKILPAASSFALFCFLILLPAGCKSAYIAATITNKGTAPVSLIEVSYPSASFGLGNLPAGDEFHYRFKVQGSDEIKMQFHDAGGKMHTSTGPSLSEGQRGTLTITIGADNGVTWVPELK